MHLRDVLPQDYSVLRSWRSPDVLGEFNQLGPYDRDLSGIDLARLLVVRAQDGVPIGDVNWHPVWYGPNSRSRALNIGINLVPAERGRGYGTEAQRLLALHLFATTGVYRVEASTDVENVAEQRSLEKAGFHREGVLRGAQHRAGAWHDLVQYGMVRADLGRLR